MSTKKSIQACLGCAGTRFDEIMQIECTNDALYSCIECFAVYRWPLISKAPHPVSNPMPPNLGTYGATSKSVNSTKA